MRVAAFVMAIWLLVVGTFACGREQVTRVVDEPIPSAHPVLIKVKKPKRAPSKQRSASPAPVMPPRAQPAPGLSGSTVRMSWYGYGPGTASGERYSPSRLACAAAKRWPLRIYLNLRNPENGRKARVYLNDRGGFEAMGRSLDCTPQV